MEACLAPIKPACTHQEVQVYEGLEKASNFLCRDGLEQYRNHRVCFADNALTEEGHYCNFTYTQEVELARLNKEPLEERTKKLCKNTGKFMECVQKAVRRHCGGGAANWVHSVNLKVFTPFMDSIGCHDHRMPSSEYNMPVAVILGVVMALFVLLSLIITSIICHGKTREHSLSLNRLNTGTSGTLDDKKTRSEVHILQKMENNIYSTSPKKMCAVNGNVRTTEMGNGTDHFTDEKKTKDDLSEIVLTKWNNVNYTYERINIMSDVLKPSPGENSKNQEQWRPNDHTEKDKKDSPTTIKKDNELYMPETSSATREESEHLLLSGDDWKNDSDLDSEGFPPPPPPICQQEEDLQPSESPIRVNTVNPFFGIPAEGGQIWVPSQSTDPFQTEVKQTMPPSISLVGLQRSKSSAGTKNTKRNSNLYEEEVDRLLEPGNNFLCGKDVIVSAQV